MKNLLLLFCLFLSSCYVNKFNEYSQTQQPTLDENMWAPLTTSPVFIDNTVPYVVYTGTDKIIYIYKDTRNHLIYLEHNPQQNTTKQQNISAVKTAGYTLKQLTYTEFGSQKIIGLIEKDPANLNPLTQYHFKSYIIHNNFSTSPQYNFEIPNFKNDTIFLNFHTASKGTLMYPEDHGGDKKIRIFNLNLSVDPPTYASSAVVSDVAANEDPYLSLPRAKKSVALYATRAGFDTFVFEDSITHTGPRHSSYSGLRFSLMEGNNIWTTFSKSSKMTILKIPLNNDGSFGILEEVKSELSGKNGIIARGADSSSYFLASQNRSDNKLQVSKTTDTFNTLELLGVASLGSTTLTNINLISLDGIPYLSYVDTSTKELTILKYSNNDLEHGALLQARISINSTTVSRNTPFTVSAASSMGNNLSYFWNVSPNNGAVIENSTQSTTKITLPPSSSKIKIVLEINDGVRSDRTTQEVTVL